MDSISMDVPGGAASTAARSSIRLNEARRRLPQSPMMVAIPTPFASRDLAISALKRPNEATTAGSGPDSRLPHELYDRTQR